MKNIFNFKIFFFFLVLLISILIVIKIDILQVAHYSIYKTKSLFSKELKRSIKITMTKAIEENSYYFQSIVIKLMTNTAKKKFNNRNILEIRNLILNDYILDPEQITYFEKPELVESIKFNTYPDKNSKIMGVNFYKINNYSIIEHSKYHSNNKKKLLIYIQGHRGNPYNVDYFINIKEHYKQKGFDIMSLSMSNLGYNEESVSFPLIDLERDDPHEMYHKFYDEKYPNKKPLSLMLSGNYYLIKKILSDSVYEEVYMIGVSGGGWYTTFLASIIPEIKTSYAFSATSPIFLKYFWGNKGHWEDSGSKIYKKIDYWDLYLLSTIDKFNKQNRKHFQVYSKNEEWCANLFKLLSKFKSLPDPTKAVFATLAPGYNKTDCYIDTVMKKTSDNLESPNFKVVSLNSDKHAIDINFLFTQF